MHIMKSESQTLSKFHLIWIIAKAATALALLVCASSVIAAEDNVVEVGAGSYSVRVPAPCKPLPEKIYKSADLKGPTVTGQWWSSLLWQEFSANLFAHPLGLVCTAEGLAVSYPGANIVGSANAIMGGGVGKDGDFKIGHSAAVLLSAECGGYSDWFVTAAFVAGDASLKTILGHGIPFVFCTYEGGQPMLTLGQAAKVWAGAAKHAV